MKVIIVDFETTGIDTAQDRITEIGAQICDSGFGEVERELTLLCYASDYPELTPEVVEVTGITNELLRAEGIEPRTAILQLAQAAKDAGVEFAVAYNAKFDRGMFEAEVKRLSIDMFPEVKYLLNCTWLCAMTDVEENYSKKCWKLSHLCLDHGLSVDPSILHRAVNDVNLTRRMLFFIKTSISLMYSFHVEPWVYVRAKTIEPWKDGGKSNALAKAAGYSYGQARGDERKFDKQWVKRVKKSKYELELTHPFQVVQVV